MMLKKEITYNDLDGKPVTETFYFNLSKAELAEMALRFGGVESLQAMLKRMVEANNGDAIIQNFKMILIASVGRRSENGRLLLKNPDIQNEFLFSGAYDVLFMEILTDTQKCIDFIKAIVPSDMSEGAEKQMKIDVNFPMDGAVRAVDKVELPELTGDHFAVLNWGNKKRMSDYTLEELGNLSAQEFQELKDIEKAFDRLAKLRATGQEQFKAQ